MRFYSAVIATGMFYYLIPYMVESVLHRYINSILAAIYILHEDVNMRL